MTQTLLFKPEVKIKILKFKDEIGKFFLNGIEVNYSLRTNYITDYHLEFRSNGSNLITNTGYRSDFFEEYNVLDFGTFKEFLIYEIERLINYEDTGKPKKKQIKYNLRFENAV
ncbi:hypothetical protein CCP1ISM_2100002 [Azospirillaceae bacterium]